MTVYRWTFHLACPCLTTKQPSSFLPPTTMGRLCLPRSCLLSPMDPQPSPDTITCLSHPKVSSSLLNGQLICYQMSLLWMISVHYFRQVRDKFLVWAEGICYFSFLLKDCCLNVRLPNTSQEVTWDVPVFSFQCPALVPYCHYRPATVMAVTKLHLHRPKL